MNDIPVYRRSDHACSDYISYWTYSHIVQTHILNFDVLSPDDKQDLLLLLLETDIVYLHVKISDV